jgi:hypothetical protein
VALQRLSAHEHHRGADSEAFRGLYLNRFRVLVLSFSCESVIIIISYQSYRIQVAVLKFMMVLVCFVCFVIAQTGSLMGGLQGASRRIAPVNEM